MAALSGAIHDTEEPDELHNSFSDYVHSRVFPDIIRTVFGILDTLLPHLSRLQLRVLDRQEVIRDIPIPKDIHTGVIASGVYAEDVDLPRLFREIPPDPPNFSLWGYTS